LISHSLPVVAQMATHIAVMRAGQFAEFGPANLILEHPQGSYTKELLAAVPEIPRSGEM
jgi:ABC-type dipeptide/oligopeptide/nickel transport system ATPase component